MDLEKGPQWCMELSQWSAQLGGMGMGCFVLPIQYKALSLDRWPGSTCNWGHCLDWCANCKQYQPAASACSRRVVGCMQRLFLPPTQPRGGLRSEAGRAGQASISDWQDALEKGPRWCMERGQWSVGEEGGAWLDSSGIGCIVFCTKYKAWPRVVRKNHACNL